jgi:hypothetical protein
MLTAQHKRSDEKHNESKQKIKKSQRSNEIMDKDPMKSMLTTWNRYRMKKKNTIKKGQGKHEFSSNFSSNSNFSNRNLLTPSLY